jgi:hypothetical protein
MNRFMTSIFCDDIRKEEGNKFSYMGIYSSGLRAATLPLVLPKLCVAMSLHCRGAGTRPSSLVYMLYRDAELLAELPFDMAQTDRLIGAQGDIEDDHALVTTSIMQIFPLLINAPCKIKARCLCDGEELRGGVLTVELAPAQ